MYERTTLQGTPSIPTWEMLHTWLRERMQELVQWALEAEVTELLGRARYQRRAEVDALPGYRNGPEEASQADHAPGDGDVAAAPGAGVGGAC
jgi:transposase-like protein